MCMQLQTNNFNCYELIDPILTAFHGERLSAFKGISLFQGSLKKKSAGLQSS